MVMLLAPNLIFGQLSDDFQPLQPSGEIPKDITIGSSEKFRAATEGLEEGTRSKKAKEDFFLESNFLIDQVLHSGRVLFNDPVTKYLNDVLAEVLKDEPELRNKIRVYSVRSSIVNSFTTNDGIILVNLGLMAQLENEAQLAFVLCHEIAHYTEKHVINAYIQNEELKNGEAIKRTSFDSKLLEQSQYSKDLEQEADKLGLQRFLKTNYSTSSLANVFEVLRYAHLPFDDIPFDRDYFNTGYYKIHESYYLNNVRSVEAMSDIVESTSHPSPRDRKQLLLTALATENHDGKDYVLGEAQFEEIRNICRFELTELYLQSDSPVKSIYNTFLLQQKFPDNRYLKKAVARALYRLSKFKSGGNYGFVHPGYSHIEGESQQLFHLLYQLKPEELCILATGYLWRLRAEIPEDEDIVTMSNDLMEDMMGRFYVPGMFSQTAPPEDWDKPDTTNITSKYDRLKEKAKHNPRLSMVKFALVDLFENDSFKAKFDSLEQKYWGAERKVIDQENRSSKNNLRHWKNHGFSLGIDKVVVVSPTYSKLDLRKKQQHKFLHSESAKSKLLKQIRRSARLLNMEVQVIDQTEVDSSQVEEFNDITFLNQWVDGRFTDLEVGMANLPSDKVNALIGKYGTEHFAWTGIINYRENKPLMYFYLLYALIPPAIPFAVYYLVRPNYDTYYYCIVFNIRTGEPELVNYNNYRKRDGRDMINSSVYDSFWQMKRKPKEKE
jgi:hypothetical protein